jgi:hypothetical protein
MHELRHDIMKHPDINWMRKTEHPVWVGLAKKQRVKCKTPWRGSDEASWTCTKKRNKCEVETTTHRKSSEVSSTAKIQRNDRKARLAPPYDRSRTQNKTGTSRIAAMVFVMRCENLLTRGKLHESASGAKYWTSTQCLVNQLTNKTMCKCVLRWCTSVSCPFVLTVLMFNMN